MTVSRGGGTLYTINGTTDSNGKVDVDAARRRAVQDG